jgi:hypothetical protein
MPLVAGIPGSPASATLRARGRPGRTSRLEARRAAAAGTADSAPVDEAGVVFPRRPPIPRPIHPRFETQPGLISEEPTPVEPPQPLPPLPGRVEIGPENGPFQVFENPTGSIRFLVDDGAPPTASTASGDDLLLDPSFGVISEQFFGTPRRPPKWVCKISNTEADRFKYFARVLFPVRRAVRVTEIPRDRFTTVFEGALRWLTPVVSTGETGELIVSMSEPAAEVLDFDPVRIDVGAVTGLTIEITPVEFEVLTAARMLEIAYNELVDRIRVLARPDTSLGDRYKRFLLLMGPDFVERLLSFSFGGERNIASLAAFHLTDGDASSWDYSAVRSAFETLGIPTVLNAFSDDPVLLATFNVSKVVAEAGAFVGTLKFITLRLFLLIGTRTSFEPHPISQMPDHPRFDEYRNEWTQSTTTRLTTRFTASIEDFDADAEGVFGEIAPFVIDAIGRLPSAGELADLIEDAARKFIADNIAA